MILSISNTTILIDSSEIYSHREFTEINFTEIKAIWTQQSVNDVKREAKTTIKAILREECNKILDSFVRRI